MCIAAWKSFSCAKATGAMSGLIDGFVPQFAQQIRDASQLPLDPVTQLMTQQVLQDKAFIDDVFAQRYPAFYKDLQTGYAQTSRLGDALAAQIAQKYPDKFPGDPAAPAVDMRVTLNLLLQEHSYLATMATDAVAAGRSAENGAAASALAANADMLGTALTAEFAAVWKARSKALVAYASGDAAAGRGLAESFPGVFASLAHVSQALVASQISATIKVIDEQRAKSSKTLAADDRAAATAMQPMADSIQR